MNEIFKGVDAQLLAPQGAHNARGHGLTHAKGIANGQYGVAHLQTFHLAQHDGGQFGQVNFQQSQIRFGICANHFGHGGSTIVQDNFNGFCAFNDMVVGQDIAL